MDFLPADTYLTTFEVPNIFNHTYLRTDYIRILPVAIQLMSLDPSMSARKPTCAGALQMLLAAPDVYCPDVPTKSTVLLAAQANIQFKLNSRA